MIRFDLPNLVNARIIMAVITCGDKEKTSTLESSTNRLESRKQQKQAKYRLSFRYDLGIIVFRVIFNNTSFTYIAVEVKVMKNRTFILSMLIFGLTCSAFGDGQSRPKVIMQTTFGDIGLELYADEAPVTAENFLTYVNDGFYDGLVFHRIIDEFMIQGGGYTYENGIPFPRATKPAIINESYNGLKNLRGTIAMARYTNPDSATSQFFINLEDNPWLDYPEAWDGIGYCVFGHVISGMDVVDAIGSTPTDNIGFGYTDFPYPEAVYTERVYEPEPEYWIDGDFNNDGIVNFTDFATFASSLTPPPADPNEVPQEAEPEVPEQNIETNMQALLTFTQNWLSTADWYE